MLRSHVLFLTALTLVAAPAQAQTASTDRSFLNFAEDATVADRQWWEGQLVFQEGDVVDVIALRGVFAGQIVEDVEVGGSVGFGSTDGPSGFDDGSGATDLDLWGKYHFGARNNGRTEFAAGGRVIVPIGDDSVGLGADSFAFGIFGSARHRADSVIWFGNVGIQVNGDGEIFDIELDGEGTIQLGGGVIVPVSDRISFVGELRHDGERFENTEDAAQVLGGLNWRLKNQSQLRFALAIGLDDGAPDGQVIAGWAAQF